MSIKERHESLKKHLKEENPLLLELVQKYELLDSIGYKSGFLQEDDSYTGNISWWPIVSVLGTFSAGKSSFINTLMGAKIQHSGNQAVDDKFTAICYGESEDVKTLPGIALNSDPRFPFYGISDEIEKIESGEGNRINLYMQLKTTNSPKAKGKIFIDSPGFDADEQRDTILRMTKHIVDISDLVLIFFDARHPEPGAMRDTLEHLVSKTMEHADADKILYILNQIDTTSKEDNLEDIISSWQRALAQKGLITGNFYTIYNENLAEISDEAIEKRLKIKKDAHLKEIEQKIDALGIQRSYRIASLLTNTAKDFIEKRFPKLKNALNEWSKKVLIADSVSLLVIFFAVFALNTTLKLDISQPTVSILEGASAFVVFVYIHFFARKTVAKIQLKKYIDTDNELANAFETNTRWYKPLLSHKFKTWNLLNFKKLQNLLDETKLTIQKLNDMYIMQDEK